MATQRKDKAMRKLVETAERKPQRRHWLGLRAQVKHSDGHDSAYCPARIFAGHPDKQVRWIAQQQAKALHDMREHLGYRRACPRPKQDQELRAAVYNKGLDSQLAAKAQGTINSII